MSNHSVLKRRRRLFVGVFLLSGILCVLLLWVVLKMSPAGINDENVTESGGTAGINPAPEANEALFTPSYASNPEEIKTLDDLLRLNYERKYAFASSFPDRITCSRHYHEFYLRGLPSHEAELVLSSLEEATSVSPWDLDRIEDAGCIVDFGTYDARILEKFKYIIGTLVEQYCSLHSGDEALPLSEASARALNTCHQLLRSVGRIHAPDTVDYLISHILRESLPSLYNERTAESQWKLFLACGALGGIENLPFYDAIPVWELIFEHWFPGAPTTVCCLQDEEQYSQKDLRYLLIQIDESYRQAYCDITVGPYDLLLEDVIAEKVDMSSLDWPQPTFRYGPGGVKLPLCPIER